MYALRDILAHSTNTDGIKRYVARRQLTLHEGQTEPLVRSPPGEVQSHSGSTPVDVRWPSRSENWQWKGNKKLEGEHRTGDEDPKDEDALITS